MKKRIITTCTRDCPNACGLVAEVEGGRVVALRGNPAHPLTRGFACRKCIDFVKRGESPQRVMTPLRRDGSGWRPVSWTEALDEIAGRMLEIRERRGAEAILYYRGFAQRTALKLLNDLFFNLFGGVTGTSGTLCGGTGQAAQELDFGRRISHDPGDHLHSRSLVLWGRNPAATNPYLVPIIDTIRKRGGTVVLIDPVASESARLCDLHIQPAPGRDLYLAMAAAKLILARGKEDREFLANQSEGFEGFRALLDAHPFEELARSCDVPPGQIEALAELFTEQGPTAISLGWGVHRWELGHQSVRAIDGLAAVAGTIGIAGGGVSQGFEEYAPYDLSWTGDGLHPGRRRFLMPRIGEEILRAADPPIEMIFVTAGNPVCMAPNSARVAAAFAKTPFVVVAGHFLDDTADFAHIFLPTTTFLEEQDVVASYGHNYVGPVNRAVEPPGECRSDFDIFRALAARFPFATDFDLPVGRWLARLLAPVLAQGVSMEELAAGPVRLPAAPLVPFSDRQFPTPSGRFRFMTSFDPPVPCSDPAEFPYHLLSVSPREWLCSELVPTEASVLTEVRLHPEEGERLGVEDGAVVRLVSPVGETLARLRFASGERRDVVVFPRGRWVKGGSSANLLTLDLVSRVGNGAPYYETRVRIEPP